MIKPVVAIALLVGILFATNMSEVNAPALVDVDIKTTATVTIAQEFMNDTVPLIGISYNSTVEKSIVGAIVSSDGYIIANAEMDNETVKQAALSGVMDNMIHDAGNELHKKDYAINAADEELKNYRKKVSEDIGGENELHTTFTDAYLSKKINVTLREQKIVVTYLGNEKRNATVISNRDGILLLRIVENNLPVVSLAPDNPSTGNAVNVMSPTSGGSSRSSFVSNDNGETTAFFSGGKIIRKNIIDMTLENNGILKKEPSYQKDYEKAIELHEQGNESGALDKFKNVLELQPKHSYAKEYVNSIETTLKEQQLKDVAIETTKSVLRKVKSKIPNEVLVAIPFVATVLLVVTLTVLGSKIPRKKRWIRTHEEL